MFKFKTVKTKIIVLFSTIFTVFFTMSIWFQIYEIKEHAFETVERSSSIIENMLVEHISAYVYNNDKENIQLSLNSIKSDYVDGIYILDTKGNILAKNNGETIEYEKYAKFDRLLELDASSLKNTQEYITLSTFSVLDVPIGYMVIEANLNTYKEHIEEELSEIAFEVIALLVVFFITSFYVVKSITNPIEEIVKTLQYTHDDELLVFPKQNQKEFQYLTSSITDKHKSLLESKSQLNTIFDMTTDGIAIVDLKTNFLFVNYAFSEITGYDKKKLYGIAFFDMVLPSFKDEITTVISEIFEKGLYQHFEKRCSIETYQTIETIINMKIMPDKKSMMIVVKDVTKESQYKKEKEEQERQLLQQSRMAQMGEMISMIAHQWRQPLSSIAATSIDLVLKIELDEYDLETEEGREACKECFLERLENIEEYTQNLTTTINDFRNFYKPNKKSELVKIEDVVSKTLKIIDHSLKKDSINIIYDYQYNEPIELYDGEVMQVVLNILKNAQDNFKEKEIKNPMIKITTKDRSLTICDNGGGIPEKIMENIFDPYFSTKDEKNGTGLGLYMSKIIIEDHHNGSLLVSNIENEDGEGKGVCFEMKIGLSSNKTT